MQCRAIRCGAIAATLALTVGVSVARGQSVWVRLGEGQFTAVTVMHDNTAIAALVNFTYRSTDGGVTWTEGGTINGESTILRHDDKGNLYVGTGVWGGGRVARSTDRGITWQDYSDLGISRESVWDIALDADDDIFVAAESTPVIRSTDDGATWSRLSFPNDATDFRSVAVAPNGHVFAGANGQGIFRSTDNGDSWSRVYSRATTVDGLAISGSGRIYAATVGSGLLISDDGGSTWTPSSLNDMLGGSMAVGRTMAMVAPGDVYVSGTRSGNGGAGWSVFRTTDDGATWTDVGSGLTGAAVKGLAGGTNGRILVASEDGLFMRQFTTDVPGSSFNRSTEGITILSGANGGATALVVEPGEDGRGPLRILDLTGTIVATCAVSATGTTRIDLGNLSLGSGIYFCGIEGVAGKAVPMIISR